MVSSKEIFTYVHKQSFSSWQHYCDTITLTNKLKYIKETIKQQYTPPELIRRQDIAITNIKIGHTFITHSFLISKHPLPPIFNTC